MDQQRVLACMTCGNRVHSTDQRTCPHCLEPLRTRAFSSEASFQDYRRDRGDHGPASTSVEPVRATPMRGVRGALLFVGVLLTTAAAGILLAGISDGGALDLAGAFGDAVVPLAMGAAMIAVAWQYGGGAR